MLKRFPGLPENKYPVDTGEILELHPVYLNADTCTDGDVPMVDLCVTTAEAFLAIRHWVYTQDQQCLLKVLLGEELAASVDPGVFSIDEPVFGSLELFHEWRAISTLSVAFDYLDISMLIKIEARLTNLKDLAMEWVLINDEFWAVVLTLERMIPVAREFRKVSTSNSSQ